MAVSMLLLVIYPVSPGSVGESVASADGQGFSQKAQI